MAASTKMLNKDEVDVVLYHGDCHDGFGSAFIAWLYFDGGRDIQYIACHHGTEFVDYEKVTGKNVLMCDFAYPLKELSKIIEVCNSFLVIDHHQTAQARLACSQTCLLI
jgi:oligoribonuclease NrnB/cAMP/cGMP phosphodiesterase (DHH superfamily)